MEKKIRILSTLGQWYQKKEDSEIKFEGKEILWSMMDLSQDKNI